MLNRNKLLVIPVWIRILPFFDNRIPARISKITNVTYAHLVKMAKVFKSKNWIYIEKKGRTNICTLTAEGKEIANLCFALKEKSEIEL